MKKFSVLLLTGIVLFSCSTKKELNRQLDPNQKLIPYTFFGIMQLSIPESCTRLGEEPISIASDIYLFENETKTVALKIRKKEAVDLSVIQQLSEQMASSFYKGEIHRSEIQTINGRQVYLLDMTGFWNGSLVKESWMKFYTVNEQHLYQCLIRYPEADRKTSTKLRNSILNSFQLVE